MKEHRLNRLKKLEELTKLDCKFPIKMTCTPHGDLGHLDVRKKRIIWIASYENLKNANHGSYWSTYSVHDINGKTKTFPARFIRSQLRSGNIIFGNPEKHLRYGEVAYFVED